MNLYATTQHKSFWRTDKSPSSVPTKKLSPSPYSVNKCYLQCDYFYQQKVNSDDSSDKDVQIVDLDSSTDEEDFITELDNYLKSPRVKNIKNPLNWWYENHVYVYREC